ncbi:MAG: Gfo/Idh/MocA family oxidoreductase [Actinobacteria bacterium]|nr:Gfo/Idh/MocA family oxidoreductase [Actinomycetota bacterium]
MADLKAVIVGCGGMGHSHAFAARQEPGVDVVGGCDIVPEALARFRQAWGVSHLCATWDELYERAKPDIAIITTHAPQHAAATIAAAERGIHVFCEKPMALSLAECDAMVSACERHKVKLALNHIKRGSRYNQLARRLIADGEIGEVFAIEAYNKGGRTSGIEMMEMGTHISDWCRVFAPEVQWVHAHITTDGLEPGSDQVKWSKEVNPRDRDCGLVVGHRTFASFGAAGGVHIQINFWMNVQNDDRGYGLDVIGTRGRLALRGSVRTWMWRHSGSHMSPVYDHQWIPVTLPAEDAPDGWPLSSEQNRAYMQRNMLRDLMEAVREDREPFSSGRDGRAALEMMHGAWESHRRKSRIAFPMAQRQHPLETWRAEAAMAVPARAM